MSRLFGPVFTTNLFGHSIMGSADDFKNGLDFITAPYTCPEHFCLHYLFEPHFPL